MQGTDLFQTPCIFFTFSERNVSDYALVNIGVGYSQVSKNKTERGDRNAYGHKNRFLRSFLNWGYKIRKGTFTGPDIIRVFPCV